MIILFLLITILCFLVTFAVLLFFVAEIIALFSINAPFVPMPTKVVKEIVEKLELEENSVFYDLGSGNGKILIEAAKLYPNAKIIGVEVAFWPYLLSKFYTRKYKNISIRRENIFKTDLYDATIIFMYLLPGVPDLLMPIFQNKCQKGTKIISCDFEADKYKPIEIIPILKNIPHPRANKLFVYTV